MKYMVAVGSFCTRFIQRQIYVYAKSEEEAREKAIDKFFEVEMKLTSSNDAGTPQVDYIEEIS